MHSPKIDAILTKHTALLKIDRKRREELKEKVPEQFYFFRVDGPCLTEHYFLPVSTCVIYGAISCI